MRHILYRRVVSPRPVAVVTRALRRRQRRLTPGHPLRLIASAGGQASRAATHHPRRRNGFPLSALPSAEARRPAARTRWPFEYRQDGGVFRTANTACAAAAANTAVRWNRARTTAARRIVTGGGIPGESPPIDYWYTDDHYRSFRGFKVQPAQVRQ